MSKLSMTGKIAIITGGAKGMGAAHSRLFAERGATVILVDVDDPHGEALAAELRAKGTDAHYRHIDVSREEDWLGLVGFAMETYGRVDVLVNNAGVASVKFVHEATVEDYNYLFDVNMKGVFLGCKSILPAMKAAGGGSIVNISSSGGLKAVMPQLSLYIASKGAVRLFTKAVALEYSPYKIRVNSIHPGLIETPLNAGYLVDPEVRKMMMGSTMFDRPGTCEEVAEAVAFLASDAASYMTGAELAVDGGWTAN